MICRNATHQSKIALKIVAVAVFGFAGALDAAAQDASPWDGEPHAAARLIAGAAVESAGVEVPRAGIEIRLDPGWKTYWRYPGDSGVPPTFDFAGSENVKAVTPLWPAPERFADGAGGHSIGYRGDVILPLRIVPADANKPSSLHLKIGYATCSNICVPAQADLALTLSGETGAEEPVLAAAVAHVPRRVALGAGGELSITSVHREKGGAHDRVVVAVAVADGVPVDLFVEGPTADWALPLPLPVGPASGGARRFTFDLDGLPPGARAEGALLTFTAVSSGDAIEVEVHLD
jgi:DsbC/DsbD-like thiol-disulfide interchange protein